MDYGELPEDDLRDAAHEHDGHEDGDRCQCGGHHGHAHLVRAVHRAFAHGAAFLQMAVDVIDHHDGRIHDLPDRDGQRGQARRIDRIARQIHQQEGDDQRRRNRGRHNPARTPAPEEEQEDQKHAGDGPQDVVAQVLHRGHNELGVVDNDLRLDVRRQVFPYFLQFGAHGPGDVNRVAAALFLNHDGRGPPAVEADIVHPLLERVLDLGHVFQLDGNAAPRGDDDLADLFQAGKLLGRAHEEILVAAADVAAGHADVLRRQDRQELPDRQVHRGEPVVVELDADLPPQAAMDRRRRDPLDAFERVGDLIFHDLLQAGVAVLGRHADDHDRHGIDIEFEDNGRFGLFRQKLLDHIELLPHVVGRLVDVLPPLELQRDRRDPLLRDRKHFIDPGNRAEDILDRLGEERLDLLRPRPFVERHDRDGRNFDLGQQVDPQPRQRHQPQHDHRHENHEDRHGPVDRELRQPHRISSNRTTSVRIPSARSCIPLTTRLSPGRSPAAIS